MKYEITIANSDTKDCTVILCQKPKSGFHQSQMKEDLKEHIGYGACIIYGQMDDSIKCSGVAEFLKYIALNPSSLWDFSGQSDSAEQVQTVMTLARVGKEEGVKDVQYFPFGEFVHNSHPKEFYVREMWLKLDCQSLMAIKMKAGCSLSLTFVFPD
jgi:hypothetical protein